MRVLIPGTGDAEVWVKGPFLRLDELRRWANACQRMQDTFSGRADLECMEPNLRIGLEIDSAGHIKMTVDITADNSYQKHQFQFDIDSGLALAQRFLPRRPRRQVLVAAGGWPKAPQGRF